MYDLNFFISILLHVIVVTFFSFIITGVFFIIKDSYKKIFYYKIPIEKRPDRINWLKEGF